MSYRVLRSALLVMCAWVAPFSLAAAPLEKAQLDKLRAAMEAPGTGLKVISAQTSEIPGLYEVQLADGPVVYSTLAGDFFIVGDLYSVSADGYVNLAEKRRDSERMEQLAKVKKDDMIIFSPEGETRAYVSVFFDDTCYYCQKLHQEVAELNENGVEVRYLAYPRAGLGSDAFKQLASAWCADDPQATLNKLVAKQSVPENVCQGNPIAAQYKLGQELGVRGTPAIITQSGQMITGYRTAAELMGDLGLN
ncbi:MAG: DsbC family protein [Halioglobus sp.]|nr:DsbC family protein [Halioglobus sp.]